MCAPYAGKEGKGMAHCENCPRNKRCQLTPETCSQKLAEQIVWMPEIKRRKQENQIMTGYSRRLRYIYYLKGIHCKD